MDLSLSWLVGRDDPAPTPLARKKSRLEYCCTQGVNKCPREDLNLHVHSDTGPQPAAYANSATRARSCAGYCMPIATTVKKPAPFFVYGSTAHTRTALR